METEILNSSNELFMEEVAEPPSFREFPINQQTRTFIKNHFPSVPFSEWNDWHWQIKNSFTTVEALSTFLKLTDKEQFSRETPLPLRITPYYASLLNTDQKIGALRKSVVPVLDELIKSLGEENDPLHEHSNNKVKCIVHRYPDRVLFLVTGFCSTYCRYCTRTHMVSQKEKQHSSKKDWDEALQYIKEHKEVRDVLISGGDPLTLSDDRIEYLLYNLRSIEHVEIIRIGTKVPAVLPQRITTKLVNMLKKYHPLFLSIHMTHPDELTDEMKFACNRLADAGIPLGSQTVLLKGINDSVEIYKKLTHEMLKVRIRPYYLYQCDPIPGSSHFRTPVSKGLEIIKGIRGFTSGYAIPHYVIDAPGGGGKIPLLPEYYKGTDENNNVVLENYEGNTYEYPDYI